VRVFNTVCDSASIAPIVSKLRSFIFVSNQASGEHKGVWGNDSHFIFSKKCPRVRGSVRRCVVVMQEPVLSFSKFAAKSSHIFKQSPQRVTIICGIACLAWQDKFLVNNSLDVKENY
jgi:hypothetical protein